MTSNSNRELGGQKKQTLVTTQHTRDQFVYRKIYALQRNALQNNNVRTRALFGRLRWFCSRCPLF